MKITRPQLYSCVLRILARDGYHGCSLGKIASELGVARGNISHYGSKDDIIFASIERDTDNKELRAIAAFRLALDAMHSKSVPHYFWCYQQVGRAIGADYRLVEALDFLFSNKNLVKEPPKK